MYYRPIAIVNIDGAVKSFTFGHELGHILGLVHNAEQTTLVLFKGGVGYLLPGTDKRTIMA